MNHIQKNLEAVRSKIAKLSMENRELAQLSRAEVVEQFEAHFAAAKVRGIRGLLAEMQRGSHGQPFSPMTSRGAAAVVSAPGSATFTIDLAPLLAPLLEEKLVALVKQVAQSIPQGMPRAKRQERLANIADEIDRLEHEEEALIVQAEAQALLVERRPDARPEVILSLGGR